MFHFFHKVKGRLKDYTGDPRIIIQETFKVTVVLNKDDL